MCGRARLSSDVSEIKLVFSIPPGRPTPNFPPSWNVAPTDRGAVRLLTRTGPGEAFSEYQDRAFHDLPCKCIQLDEIWAFCYAKQPNVPFAKNAPEEAGDIWTWVALDAETKLIPSWSVGDRSGATAIEFVCDLSKRLANRVQVTSDRARVYLEGIESGFGGDVDYAQLVKLYGEVPHPAGRYSPAQIQGTKNVLLERAYSMPQGVWTTASPMHLR